MKTIIQSILTAIQNCKIYIISIFVIYCVSCFIGIILSHNGNSIALSQRDKIVNAAAKNDKAAINYEAGNKFQAAIFDFGGNILIGSIPQTIGGLSIIIPYVSVAYQGWVGGIVSVDGLHQSRFRNIKTALYYFIVLLLDFLAYSLSIGAGVKWGVESYKKNIAVNWKIWKYKIDTKSLKDVGYVYLVSVPIYFIASCFEFLSSWNV
jgi:hypothetical protein